MIKAITPEEIKEFKILSVQKIGDYFNWRKFRKEPLKFYLFTENAIYEYVPD